MIRKIYKTRCGDIVYWTNKLKPKKRTLVFLPGLTADHDLFSKQIEYFENKENVLVWDAPGHSESRPFTKDYDLFDKAIWLNEIFDIEKIKKPIIIGQSMGGYVGQIYTELFKDKLCGFISIDSAPIQRSYISSIEIWLLKNIEPVYRLYPWKVLLNEGSKGVATSVYGRKLMKDMMLKYNPKEYCELVGHGYRILAHAYERDLEYEFTCPVLLICGENDMAGSSKSYNKEWALQRNYPIKWIKNAGHNSNTDDPELVNKIIEEFINEEISI